MKNVFLIFIISFLILIVNATPTSKSNNPIAIQLDNHITTIISCKSRNKLKCEGLSVVAKLSNESVPYTNEIVLNKVLLPNRVTFKTYAASRIDSNSLVITAVSSDNQYIFVVGIQSTELRIIKTLQPITATSVRSTDITTIQGNQNGFYVVVDLMNNKRKVARITDTTFHAQYIKPNTNNRDRSTITGNSRGAFITHGGDCSSSRLIYVQFDASGEISSCFKTQQSRCSENGRENIVFLNDTRAILSLINQDDAYLYYLNAPSASPLAKSSTQKKMVANERDWDQLSISTFCDDANLIQNNIPINLIDKITDLQLTLDNSVSPNELAVSFERRNNLNCDIEGYLYSVNSDLTLQRIRDSNNQPVNLPNIACSALGFDRVLFDDDLILLRYEATRINLQNVFPKYPSL